MGVAIDAVMEARSRRAATAGVAIAVLLEMRRKRMTRTRAHVMHFAVSPWAVGLSL